MERSIIIIGGGLTGLSAGCYGRMNGYRTQIFEMHDMSGGVCTGWKRKGYTIDGAMNWLIGTKPGTDYNRLWLELGAAQNWQIFNHDNYINIDGENGGLITIPVDLGRLQQMLTEIAPEDKAEIRRFCRAAQRAGRLEMPADKPQELYGLPDYFKMIKMLPFLMFMYKWTRISASEYAARFKNPVMQQLFGFGNEDEGAEMPAMMMPMLFGWLSGGEGGYVIGGALELVSRIEKRYRELGGELYLKSRVEKILVEDDLAVGIRLADGTEHRADWVISAADGHATIFEMLDEKYIDEKIRSTYKNGPLFQPLIYAAFGVNHKFDEIPAALNGLRLGLSEPLLIGGKPVNECQLLIYTYDPVLAGPGKTVMVAEFPTDYDYWNDLYSDPDAYRAEKKRVGDAIEEALERRFPGISSRIEMRDLATPVTWTRYTGNWRGSYEGWMITRDSMMKQMKKTLPGLDNFYMAGQWVNPGGGMPTAVMSGNHTIQLICSKENRKFVTSLPENG